MYFVVVAHNNVWIVGPKAPINLYFILGIAHSGRFQEEFG